MSFHSFFFFNDTATTEIYTLSLHDALPISSRRLASTTCAMRAESVFGTRCHTTFARCSVQAPTAQRSTAIRDRKSTRLNSSHLVISYAVFCLKKKTNLLRIQSHVGMCQPHR